MLKFDPHLWMLKFDPHLQDGRDQKITNFGPEIYYLQVGVKNQHPAWGSTLGVAFTPSLALVSPNHMADPHLVQLDLVQNLDLVQDLVQDQDQVQDLIQDLVQDLVQDQEPNMFRSKS